MAVLINKKGKSAVIHLTANATITVAGNSSVSNVASVGEELTGATISQVWYGSSNSGHWVIKRGANTVMVLTQSGHMNFAGHSVSLNMDAGATLVAELVNTDTGFITLEMSKTPKSSTYA